MWIGKEFYLFLFGGFNILGVIVEVVEFEIGY